MQFRYKYLPVTLLSVLFTLICTKSFAQSYDTLSNWDGITQNWQLFGFSAEVVENPAPDNINSSANCYKVVTTSSEWDNISYELSESIIFDKYHHFRVKVLAPVTGGKVTFKFQNQWNSEWQEITKTPVPGEWTDLEFDFSGLYYNNFQTLVIFYDFHGTAAGRTWYIDDVIKVVPDPQPVESNLPIVVINTNDNWIPDDPKIDAMMGIIDNGPGNLNHLTDPVNHFYGSIGIETRGHSTQMFPKKSYGVETRDSLGNDLDVSLLGMPAESDWILYAPYTDKSMLRNTLSFGLCHRMNDIYCTRTRYVELVINGGYKGVYVLMEKIKKAEGRVDIATLKPDEVSGEDITGGYILSVDWLPENFVHNRDGWKSDVTPPYNNTIKPTFQFIYPKSDEIVDPQRYYIKSYVTAAENALVSTNFRNPVTGYMKYFDVPSFIDLMIISELSKDVDKYRLSQYFYKEKDNVGGKLFAGPIWDFNLGYGNVDYWSLGLGSAGFVYNDIQSWDFSIMYWWKRLMEDPYYRNLTRTRWEGLRQTSFSNESINQMIDSLTMEIDDAKDRNYARWPILGTYVWPNYDWQNNSYEDEVHYLRNFILNRANWLDYNLPGMLLEPAVYLSAEGNYLNITVAGDYFRNPHLKEAYFTINDAPGYIYLKSVEYMNPWQCRLLMSDVVAGINELSVTISEKAINTWQDVISNKLESAGLTDHDQRIAAVTLYESDKKLFIRCSQPEILPSNVQIMSISGSLLGNYMLEKSTENIIHHNLNPGVYLLTLRTSTGVRTEKFVVLN